MTLARDRLRELFPLPFVAVVALLLVLIALTPNLLSLGHPAAGSLEAEAELLIDRTPNENVTHLYVQGIGTVRYTTITLAFAHPLSGAPPMVANFTFTNTTVWNNSLEAAAVTSWNPVAVNVTARYVDSSGGVANFVGTFLFNITTTMLLAVAYLPAPPSQTSTPISSLPLTFLLESVPSGGSP